MRHTKKIDPDVITLKSASLQYTPDPYYKKPVEPLDVTVKYYKQQTIPMSVELQADHVNFNNFINTAISNAHKGIEEQLKKTMVFNSYKKDSEK